MDVAKTCRVCLSGGDELTPLRVRLPGKDKTLEETINFVANINIVLENGLPDKICKDCGTMLDVANTFKQRCLESEAIFAQIDKGTEKSQLTGENSRVKDELCAGDTSCLPTVLPFPLSSDSAREEIENEKNIYESEYKIKIEIEENFDNEGNTTGEEDNLDVKGPLLEQFVPKEEGSETTESLMDVTHNDSTWNTANVPLSDMAIGCAAETQSTNYIYNASVINTEKDQTCNMCESLNSQIKAQGATEQYTCDTCSYSTTELRSDTDHLSTPTDDKPYACNVCQKNFTTKSYLLSHMRTHTDEKPYICNVCEKDFSQKRYLVAHMRVHTRGKPYSCNVCQKDFTQKHHLGTHMRVHTGEKPYSCYVCDKNFSQKSQLVDHMRTHTGDRPYPCDVCKKHFTTKSSLVTHMRIHSGEKPYSCNVCEKDFSQKQYLVVHMRSHTGKKPHPCDICKKGFNSKYKLRIHMRQHTGGKLYPCNVCKKKFSDKTVLVAHIRTHRRCFVERANATYIIYK